MFFKKKKELITQDLKTHTKCYLCVDYESQSPEKILWPSHHALLPIGYSGQVVM